jgi:hypothetical protein
MGLKEARKWVRKGQVAAIAFAQSSIHIVAQDAGIDRLNGCLISANGLAKPAALR